MSKFLKVNIILHTYVIFMSGLKEFFSAVQKLEVMQEFYCMYIHLCCVKKRR